jgi:hypothetical protein
VTLGGPSPPPTLHKISRMAPICVCARADDLHGWTGGGGRVLSYLSRILPTSTYIHAWHIRMTARGSLSGVYMYLRGVYIQYLFLSTPHATLEHESPVDGEGGPGSRPPAHTCVSRVFYIGHGLVVNHLPPTMPPYGGFVASFVSFCQNRGFFSCIDVLRTCRRHAFQGV